MQKHLPSHPCNVENENMQLLQYTDLHLSQRLWSHQVYLRRYRVVIKFNFGGSIYMTPLLWAHHWSQNEVVSLDVVLLKPVTDCGCLMGWYVGLNCLCSSQSLRCLIWSKRNKNIHLHRVEQDKYQWRHANSFIPLWWHDMDVDSCWCRSDFCSLWNKKLLFAECVGWCWNVYMLVVVGMDCVSDTVEREAGKK